MSIKVVVETCPFCDSVPTMQPWHGGGQYKRMIACEADYCHVNPQVTGETPREAAERWNKRTRHTKTFTIGDHEDRAA